jgi:hypothetical protein
VSPQARAGCVLDVAPLRARVYQIGV